MKVLVAEDDDNIRNGLIEVLDREGYDALAARDGEEALHLFGTQAPDFVCLDIMMPKVNGYDVCREIRRRGSTIPVIFISAKTEEVDRVLGLELGADDYIMKPFGVREVVARIRAVTRRCLQARRDPLASEPFRMGALEVFPSELRARRTPAVVPPSQGGQARRGTKDKEKKRDEKAEGQEKQEEAIDLSLRDLKILQLFHHNRGRVLDRYTLFSEIWGVDHIPNSRTLDQHISQLRKRIERDPKNPAIIQTVHGVGYRYDG